MAAVEYLLEALQGDHLSEEYLRPVVHTEDDYHPVLLLLDQHLLEGHPSHHPVLLLEYQ